jgi:Zn-dependent alcohol dehydrogenase
VTNGQGADQVIVATGEMTGEVIAQGFAAIRKAGTLIVVSLSYFAERGLPISPLELVVYQKRIQGTLFGCSRPLSDILKALEMYRVGRLKLKELVTKQYRLDDIGQGYEDLLAGEIVRGVISFSI